MAAVSRRGNLDSRGSRDGQLRVGLIALAMALAAAAFLAHVATASPPWVRALVFAPFFIAAYGVLAAFTRTCGLSALMGHRHTAQGTEPVADRQELASQRRMGALVVGLSGVLAAGATVLFVFAR